MNMGLLNCFSEEVIFRDVSPEHFLQLLDGKLEQKNVSVPTRQEYRYTVYKKMRDHFAELRDV